MRRKDFQSSNFSVMKLSQLKQKSSGGFRKVTSMVKPLQAHHLSQFAAEGHTVGAGTVRKVTEAQHRAGVKGKTKGDNWPRPI